MDEITIIINNFSRKHIKLQQLWLRDCIDYFKRENTESNYTIEDLEKFVYSQWLLFDLREVDISVLPENINEEKRYELKDTITLQLLSVVDISRSKYSQIQKIRNKLEKPLESDIKEYEFKGNSKRCLQLTLTDGVRDIRAFEYKPIKNINLNLSPGMKIQFIAPLVVRYGQIMLESEKSIELLGGEVEEILISNAPENVLAAALNLPLNDHPVSTDSVELNVNPSNIQQHLKNQKNTMASALNKINSTTKKNTITSKQTHDNKPATKTEEDEFDMLLEIENELHGEENIKMSANKPTSVKTKTISGISKRSDNIFDQTCEQDVDYMLNIEDELKNEHKNIKMCANKLTSVKTKPISSKSKHSGNIFDQTCEQDVDYMLNIEDELKNEHKNIKMCANKPTSVKAKPLSGISKRSDNIFDQTCEQDVDYMLNIENELKNEHKNIKMCANKPTSVKTKPISGISKRSDNIFDGTCEQDVDYMLNIEDKLKNEQFFSKTKSAALNISNKNLSSQYNCNKSKTISPGGQNFNFSKKSVNVKSDLPRTPKTLMDISFENGADLKSNIFNVMNKSEATGSLTKINKKYEPFKSTGEIFEILSSPDDSPKKKLKLTRDPYKNPIPSTSRQIFRETTEPVNSPNIKISTLPNTPHSGIISPVKCIDLSILSKTPITTGKFKARAKFKKVIEKLTLKGDKWNIKLQIEDSSGTLDIIVEYELINKLMGYTYEELKVFAQAGAKEFKEALDTFKSKLQSLDGLIEISFVNKVPRLINIL